MNSNVIFLHDPSSAGRSLPLSSNWLEVGLVYDLPSGVGTGGSKTRPTPDAIHSDTYFFAVGSFFATQTSYSLRGMNFSEALLMQ